MPTINAAQNPDLANDILAQVMSTLPDEATETTPEVVAAVIDDDDLIFDLPGGYISPMGSVEVEAEVRELTGRDEERIAKATTAAKAINAILQSGTVRIGAEQPTEDLLDGMLTGDRDYLLMRIFAATFGSDVTTYRVCGSCGTESEVTVDLLTDVQVKRLATPQDRYFTVPISKGRTAYCELPTGQTQKRILSATDKSVPELSTMLLAATLTRIDDMDILGPGQVLDLPVRDRRKIADEIASRTPGPDLQGVKVACPSCEEEMEVAVSLTSLFQF